jgi:hypothetical protein
MAGVERGFAVKVQPESGLLIFLGILLLLNAGIPGSS